MNTPLVSVIIPSYRAAKFLGPLCKSLQAQTYQNFEVLIGDDGSDDETAEVIASFLADPRFSFFAWHPNKGVGHGTLTLLLEAKGEFWCHPGADDLLKPDFIAERVALISRYPNAVLVHGAATYIDENGKEFTLQNGIDLGNKFKIGPSFSQLLQHNTISTPGIMIRMNITRMIMPFFSNKWQFAYDWFMWLLFASTGRDFLWDPMPRHCYRIYSASLSGSLDALSKRKAETRLIPLSALGTAAFFSNEGAQLWARWRHPLYALWLMRAMNLFFHGTLRDEWLQTGAQAYYSHSKSRVWLWLEILRHAPWMIGYFILERLKIRRQSFRVSGLALVHDPLFFKTAPQET